MTQNVSSWDQDLFQKTLDFAAKSHRGQKYKGRDYGYIMHPVLVTMEALSAHISEPCRNPDLLMQTALLHDVLEDTDVDEQQLENVFGNEVLQGVMALTKNPLLEKDMRMKDSLSRILKQPDEIAMVKMAHRITNLQSPPDFWENEKKQQYLAEAKVIAAELGHAHAVLNTRLKQKIIFYAQQLADA